MKAFQSLPNEYTQICSIDLQKNKKLALKINLIALAIAVVLFVPMLFVVPIGSLFSMDNGFLPYVIRFAVLVLAEVVYLILHELTHGVAMKICGTKKIKYGFTGMYAYAGSNDYYNKTGYIFIALAPIVLWGIVLLALNLLLPVEWFWVVYFVQITNLSGAAGDIFVTYKFSKLPKDILVKDSGVSMIVYSQN